MSYKHITIYERYKIEVLNKEGYSARRIAETLGYHHSSISGELERFKGSYSADKTEEDYKIKSKAKGKSRKPKSIRGKFNIDKSISTRPKHIKKRRGQPPLLFL